MEHLQHHGVGHGQLGQGRKHGRSHHGGGVQRIALAHVQQADAMACAQQPPGQHATSQTGAGNPYVHGTHGAGLLRPGDAAGQFRGVYCKSGFGQGGLRLKLEPAWAARVRGLNSAMHGPVPICVVPYAGMTPIRFSGFHRSGLSLDLRLWRPDKPSKCMRI